MNDNSIYYNESQTPVLIGDKITFQKLFKTVKGIVVYIPGQCKLNRSLGDDTWAIQLEDEPNDIRSMAFYPFEEKYAIKKIKFVSRGNGQKAALKSDEEIL